MNETKNTHLSIKKKNGRGQKGEKEEEWKWVARPLEIEDNVSDQENKGKEEKEIQNDDNIGQDNNNEDNDDDYIKRRRKRNDDTYNMTKNIRRNIIIILFRSCARNRQ